MQILTAKEYKALREGCQVIEADGFGDKVLRLQNGLFLKLFRRKRLISSALFKSYAVRFAENAGRLQQRAIPTITMEAIYRIPEIKRTAVKYNPLPGETLRKLMTDMSVDQQQDMSRLLGRFIAELHDKGVYFRSLHLGNILQLPTGQLGLIDISDMTICSRALSTSQRLRNFRHMARYRKDIGLLGSVDALPEAYLESTSLDQTFADRLVRLLDSGR